MEGWLTLSLIALSTLLALWFFKLPGGRKQPLPPGPWRLPIIGSLHHVVSVLPHRTMTKLCRRYGPVMYLELGEIPTVVVSSAEAVGQMVKANELQFANRRITEMQDIVAFGGKGITFAPYGDYWRQMRKVCATELLSSKQVKRMESVRAEEMGSLLHSMMASASAGATVNVSQKVAALSNDVVARAVFGGKFRQQEDFIHASDKIMDLLGGFFFIDHFPSSRLVRWLSSEERCIKSNRDVMQRIITDVLIERKAARAAGNGSTCDEGLLDVLLTRHEEDPLESPLTTEMISTVLFDIFGATDTTSNTLDWAMSELINHPEIMAKAQLEVREVLGPDRAIIAGSDLAELQYLRMVIKETLRLHPPGLLNRKNEDDCKIMGYDIPKGTNILINIFATSRDPQYWNNPEEFNPERFENNNTDYKGTCFEFTPFGFGRRLCPGITLASSILEIALANFLYHFDWMLPDGATSELVDMSEKFGLIVRRRSNLQLRAIPHLCSKAR